MKKALCVVGIAVLVVASLVVAVTAVMAVGAFLADLRLPVVEL